MSPALQAILFGLERFPEQADYVVQMPGGKRVVPEELWMASIGAWVRVDGFSACFDHARGFHYFNIIDRWRLRRAIRKWNEKRS